MSLQSCYAAFLGHKPQVIQQNQNPLARLTSWSSSGYLKTLRFGEAARWKNGWREKTLRREKTVIHMVDQDRRVDHSGPTLLLLCMHTCTHTLICTYTSKPPWGLIKAVCSLSLFGNVTFAAGTKDWHRHNWPEHTNSVLGMAGSW